MPLIGELQAKAITARSSNKVVVFFIVQCALFSKAEAGKSEGIIKD
jgi:hypothetical protein